MSGASTRLYVGRLAPDTTRDDVADLFNRVGPIVDVRVLNGFGFVEFEDVRDAEYAVRDFDGTMFMGDRIIVQFAKQSTRRERDFERGPRDAYGPRGRRDGPPRPPLRRGPRRGQYRVIVFNLPPGTSWQDLKDVGREHGHVTFAEINPSYPDEGALEFETRDDYERALARIEGTELRGTLLRAEPTAEAPPPPRERSPVRRYRDDYRDERPPPPTRDDDKRDRWEDAYHREERDDAPRDEREDRYERTDREEAPRDDVRVDESEARNEREQGEEAPQEEVPRDEVPRDAPQPSAENQEDRRDSVHTAES